MRIRSITWFCNPGWPINENVIRQAAGSLDPIRQAVTAAGYEVQSVRLATPPFPHILGPDRLPQSVDFARALETAAISNNIDYLSIGPAVPEYPASYPCVPDVLAATQIIFASGLLTIPGGGVSLQAVRACGEIIFKAAKISPDGFGNLRFTALGNVQPGSPFFPAAYHSGDNPAFAFAIEAADLAVDIFTTASSLEEGRQALIDTVQNHAARLARVAQEQAGVRGAVFGGIDFTLAPHPDAQRSFGLALEKLGVPAVGLAGSLAAAAILADTLDRAELPRVGFTGLMLPVLEDSTLAQRAAQGLLTVSDLLLYSSVCGTGLDTVPLPGDATPEQLSSVLLDLASLSQRLNKPLTARLMPIPGKIAGEPTNFEFAFFANSRVIPLKAATLQGLLAGNETFTLYPRIRK